MLLVARVTPPLVAGAAADRAFRADATTPTTPGRGLDIRASVGGLTETEPIDQITKFIDDLPGWATPQVSASPLYPYTDPRNPTPVIRTKDGQHEATAVVYSRGDANTSLVPAPGTTPVDTGDEPGVWVPDTVAAELGVTSGDAVDVAIVVRDPTPDEIAKAAGVPVRVAGVYQTSHGLPVSHSVDWEAISASLPHDPLDTSKRAALLIADTDTAVPVITGMGDRSFVVWDAPWRVPINLEQARIGAAGMAHVEQPTARQQHPSGSGDGGCPRRTGHAVERCRHLRRARRGLGRRARAVGVVDRFRRADHQPGGARHNVVVARPFPSHRAPRRIAHGVHPARIGINGMVEQLGAIIAAVFAVYALVSWAPKLLADAGSFGPHTLATARSAVLWTLPWLIGFVVLAVTAAVWPLEPTTNAGTGKLAGAFRWETIVVIAAVATGTQLVTQDGPALRSGSALLFPLLALLAGAAIVVRVIGYVVGRTRRARPARVTGPRLLAVWLARRRLTFVITEVSALVVVVAAGVGMFLYSASVAHDGERGIADKAAALGGASATRGIGAASDLFVGEDGFPAGLPDGWTVVWRGSDVRMSPDVVSDVLVVDPDRFVETAAWRDSFADKSLPQLMDDLKNPAQSTVNVIVAGNYNDTFPTDGTLVMQGLFASYHVVDRIPARPPVSGSVPRW